MAETSRSVILPGHLGDAEALGELGREAADRRLEVRCLAPRALLGPLLGGLDVGVEHALDAGVVEGLGDEGHAQLARAALDARIVLARDQRDDQVGVAATQVLAEQEPLHARQVLVQERHLEGPERERLQRLLRRLCGDGLVTGSVDDLGQKLAHRRVVVDHQHVELIG